MAFVIFSSGMGMSSRLKQIYTVFSFQIFNRDEPTREKKVHGSVKAQDNGRPQLEDICTLAVTIQDINDNSPVFDK